MDLDTKPGEHIRFLGTGGYPRQLELAKSLLKIGYCYELESINVGSFHTSVKLKGIRLSLNSVHFENIIDEELKEARRLKRIQKDKAKAKKIIDNLKDKERKKK